ncbi:MAG TPA: hypothetical protein VHJ20_01220 [Polyangia bacterium]|nr:hypothetical protein [Polyangia bacterium]
MLARLTLALACVSGCTGRYAAPRTIAALGSLAVVAGGVSWAAGESLDKNRNATMVDAGFVAVAAGVAAIVASGGWMAVSVSCTADPDCADDEQCREIPAPPGGVPYKQCMSR